MLPISIDPDAYRSGRFVWMCFVSVCLAGFIVAAIVLFKLYGPDGMRGKIVHLTALGSVISGGLVWLVGRLLNRRTKQGRPRRAGGQSEYIDDKVMLGGAPFERLWFLPGVFAALGHLLHWVLG